MFALYENSTDQSERNAILNALSCSTDLTILKTFMAKTIEPRSKVPANTTFNAICIGSSSGIDVVLDFIVANHDAIFAMYVLSYSAFDITDFTLKVYIDCV